MSYETTPEKFAIVLNRTQPIGVLLNACSHLFIGLGANLNERVELLAYPAPNLAFTSAISAFPVIVLEAKNSSQLQSLQESALALPDVSSNVFASSMLGASAQEQIERTRALTKDTAELIAVALFGPRTSVDSLIKRFSLFKLRQPVELAQ